MNRKWWIVGVVVVLVAWLGFTGCSSQQATTEEPGEMAVAQRGTLLVTVEGTGSLAPSAEVTLAFLSGGQVAEVLVEHCPVPMKRIGMRDGFAESGPYLAILEKYGMSAAHIADAAQEVVARKG